jgi:hypothetical protein
VTDPPRSRVTPARDGNGRRPGDKKQRLGLLAHPIILAANSAPRTRNQKTAGGRLRPPDEARLKAAVDTLRVGDLTPKHFQQGCGDSGQHFLDAGITQQSHAETNGPVADDLDPGTQL